MTRPPSSPPARTVPSADRDRPCTQSSWPSKVRSALTVSTLAVTGSGTLALRRFNASSRAPGGAVRRVRGRGVPPPPGGGGSGGGEGAAGPQSREGPPPHPRPLSPTGERGGKTVTP